MSFWDQFTEVPEEKSASEDKFQQPKEEIITKELSNGTSQNFWTQFQEVPKEKSFGEKIVSGSKKLISRALEATMGFPGDIEAFVRPHIVAGQKIDKEKGGIKSFLPEISEKRIFPTSGELREISKEAHKGALEPEGKAEELAGEIFQDYIFSPGGVVKKLVLSSAANIFKEGLKQTGASEDTQSIGKAGLTFLMNFAGKRNVKDYYKSEYQKAAKSIPIKETIDSKRLSSGLTSLENRINLGVDIPAKGPAIKVIKELKEKSVSGKIPVQDLDRAYHDINNLLFDKKNLAPTAEHWLGKTKQMISHELKRYGKGNPEYLQHFKDANAAYSGLAQGQKATNFIKGMKKAAFIGGPAAIIAELHFAGPEATAATAAALASAYGVANVYDLGTRIFSNPTLFKYYTKAMASAANENKAQFLKNLRNLDKGLREENLETSRFVDVYKKSKNQ